MSNTPTPETKPTWQKPAYLIGGAIVILLLIFGILAASGAFSGKQPTPVPTAAPLPTAEPGNPIEPAISILEPGNGAVLDIANPVTVSGEGQGLFEGNVVVQAVDAHGQVLAEEATVLKMTREADATGGVWSVELDVRDVMPGTKGQILAFSTDPKSGDRVAETSIAVTFGEPVEAMISIQEPGNGAVLDIANPVTVKGEGQGLFEGNVVVHAEDANAAILAEATTTLQGKDVGTGGKGDWSTDLNLQDVVPGTTGRIVAFSIDPKTGARVAETSVSVTYGEEEVAGPSTLEGTLWALALLNGQQPLEDAPIYVLFENGKLSGSAGCNTYNGGYQSDNKNLSVSNVVATRQSCAEPAGVMEQESTYLKLLGSAATYSTANGSLTIFDANGNAVLNYKPAVAGELNYKARIALPDTAQVIVTLEDVSKADAPAVVIGQTIMAAPAGPPIPFVVTYSLNDIDSTHTYAVRAQIKDADGALLFTSTTSYQVITRGNPSYVEIELVQP